MLNWLHYMWFSYFWPSLKGNGPEAIVQTVTYAAIGYLVYPPFREWINSHFNAVHARHDDVLDHLKHIIEHHPDIPELPKKD